MLDRGQLDEFTERGFLVLPRVVPPDVLADASQAVDELIECDPPGPEMRRPYNYFAETARVPALAALLAASLAFGLAESLTGTRTLDRPWQVQVALNIPPFPHRPGSHHIDGAPPGPDGRPGTFTMLAGILMSEQRGQDAGNLWVWPGTHLTHAEYFREHGPDAFFAASGYPPIRLPEPEQVTGGAADLFLAHYLLGHNIGGNIAGGAPRRLLPDQAAGHDPRWRDFLQNPWLDYDSIRERLGDTGNNREYNPG